MGYQLPSDLQGEIGADGITNEQWMNLGSQGTNSPMYQNYVNKNNSFSITQTEYYDNTGYYDKNGNLVQTSSTLVRVTINVNSTSGDDFYNSTTTFDVGGGSGNGGNSNQNSNSGQSGGGKFLSAISIPIGTIETGFATANVLKAGLKDIAMSAKALGGASDVIAFGSIVYDFSTGKANTSTVLNGVVLVGGAVVVGVIGVAAAPWVAGFGVVYGIGSMIFEKPLNNAFDISGSINFVSPNK